MADGKAIQNEKKTTKEYDSERKSLEESKSKTIGTTVEAMKKVSSENVAGKNDTTIVALAVVIVGLLTGIFVYCIVSYYRKTQGEKVVQPKQPRVKYLTK